MALILEREADTAILGRLIAEHLSPVDCVTLTGNLGAGKTTLMRHLIWHLQQGKEAVISPSFLVMQEYEVWVLGAGGCKVPGSLWHVDGYRLNDESEIPELGLEELLESAIVAIEWPERFERFLPPHRLELTLELINNNSRKAILQGKGDHGRIADKINKEFHHYAK